MEKITTAALAASADKEAEEKGTSPAILMLRAAHALSEHCAGYKKIAVVCGSGNNGGDGYAAATLIRDGVTVFFVAEPKTADARFYREQCEKSGIPVLPFEHGCLNGCDCVLDCLFGVGLKRKPEGLYARVIEEINVSGAFVISADLPSGLFSDSGLAPVCVNADVTVTFGAKKAGMLLADGQDKCGRVVVADIGTDVREAAYLVEREDVRSVFPRRKRGSNKGMFGYIALIGGCGDYTGAPKLSNIAAAAMRSGAGVVRLCVPRSIGASVSPYLLESTMYSVPDENGHMLFSEESIDAMLKSTRACAVGMGWGDGKDNARILEYILSVYDGRLLLDADALNTVARMGSDVLKGAKPDILITPHPGEFARLCRTDISSVLDNPIERARQYAEKYGVTVLLKGAATTVSDGRDAYIVSRGCAGMATAGSGDVLSGIICALLGFSPESACTCAAAGAYLAGVSGEFAQAETGAYSMIASDTVRHISDGIKYITGA